jgi:hypothetical protein
MLELYHKLFKYSVKNKDAGMLSVVEPHNVRALYDLQKEAYHTGGGKTAAAIVRSAPIVFARFHGELETKRMITIPDNVVLIMPYCCGLVHFERTDFLFFASVDQATLRQNIQRNGHIKLIGKTFLKLVPGMKVCDVKVSLMVEKSPVHIPIIGMYTFEQFQERMTTWYSITTNLFYDDVAPSLYQEQDNAARVYKNNEKQLRAYLRYLIREISKVKNVPLEALDKVYVMFKQSYPHIVSLLFHRHNRELKNMYNDRVVRVARQYNINISRGTYAIEDDIKKHKDAVRIVREIDYVGLVVRFIQNKLDTMDLDATPVAPELMEMLEPLKDRPDNDPIKMYITKYLRALSFVATTTMVSDEGYNPLVYDRQFDDIRTMYHSRVVPFLVGVHHFDVPAKKWHLLATLIHEVTSLNDLQGLEETFRMKHYDKDEIYLSDIIKYLSEHRDYKDGVVLFNNSCQGVESDQVCMSKKCIDLARNKGTERSVTTFEQNDMKKVCECLAYMNARTPLVLDPVPDAADEFPCELAKKAFYHHIKKTNPKILSYMQQTNYKEFISFIQDSFMRYVNVVLNDYIYQAYRAKPDPKIVEYMGEPVTI